MTRVEIIASGTPYDDTDEASLSVTEDPDEDTYDIVLDLAPEGADEQSFTLVVNRDVLKEMLGL